MAEIRQLHVAELAELLKGAQPPVVLDVREPWEVALASVPGTINIPLGELARQWENLEPESELVIMCHHGGRSMQACMFLAARGFEKLANLAGGIDAWSAEVDATTPRY